MTRSWFRPLVAPAALVAVCSATPAFAGPLPDVDKLKDRAESALEYVDATPRQREQTWSILESALEHMRAWRSEGQALRERLWQAFVSGDKVDRGQVHSIRLQLVDLFDRATGRGFDVMSDVLDVFTPQQRQQLREFRQSKGGGRHEASEKGGRGGGAGKAGKGVKFESGTKSERGRQRDRGSDTVPR